MLRGTLVLFAGMFTLLILRRRLFIHHWLGMLLITVSGTRFSSWRPPAASSSVC